jgi:hypothetical protein
MNINTAVIVVKLLLEDTMKLNVGRDVAADVTHHQTKNKKTRYYLHILKHTNKK